MKFAASLIAMGASAVKLAQEDEAHGVQRIVDWNGDGAISKLEAIDQVNVYEAMGYLTEDQADATIQFYNTDLLPDEFTFDYVTDMYESTGDERGLNDFLHYIEYSENVTMDMF